MPNNNNNRVKKPTASNKKIFKPLVPAEQTLINILDSRKPNTRSNYVGILLFIIIIITHSRYGIYISRAIPFQRYFPTLLKSIAAPAILYGLLKYLSDRLLLKNDISFLPHLIKGTQFYLLAFILGGVFITPFLSFVGRSAFFVGPVIAYIIFKSINMKYEETAMKEIKKKGSKKEIKKGSKK
jgi:hypothetical protein